MGKLFYNYFSNKRLSDNRSCRAFLNLENFPAHSPYLTIITRFKLSSLDTSRLYTDGNIARCSQVPPQRESSSFELSRLSHPQHRISRNKFGVPPSPKIEGREEPRVSLPSISDKATKDPIDEQTIKEFDTLRVSSSKVHRVPCIASLLIESSDLWAAGSFLRGFRH